MSYLAHALCFILMTFGSHCFPRRDDVSISTTDPTFSPGHTLEMEAFTNSTSEPDLRTSNITHTVHVNGMHVTFETTSEESMEPIHFNPTTTPERLSDGLVDSDNSIEGILATTGEGNDMTMVTDEIEHFDSTLPFDDQDETTTAVTTSSELDSIRTSFVPSTNLPSDETRFTEESTKPEAAYASVPDHDGILGKTENNSTSLNSKRRNPNVERNGLCTWNYRWLIYSVMAYPGQPYPGQMPPGQADPLWGYFSAVAGANGQIDAQELQGCLTSSGISGTYKQFSLETCRIMINMLDRDYSGQMGFNEFKELWGALNQWKTCFMTYDRDSSGAVEPHEFHTAIRSFGYNLSPQALNIIVKRYSGDGGRIVFDDFVSACVRLRLLTDQFRRRDASQTGNAHFSYDDFVQVTMSA